MLPNIVFITSHDLGQHLGCYGHETVRSPALDALARRGVLFERSFCPAPQCSPSRAALHTGRYPHAVNVLGLAHNPFCWHLDPPEAHIVATLQQAGYHTALFGIQHVIDRADKLAYDVVHPTQPAPIMAQAVADHLASLHNAGRPFYVEVGFHEPHRVYDYGGAEPDETLGVEIPPYVPDIPEAREDFAALQGAIRALDTGVGIIWDALEKHGLAEDTWLIFVPDHGLAMPRAKCTLYDPGLETALIMHWPARGLVGGQRFEQMVSHVDMVPTLLEGLGLPDSGGLHGRSYWPLLQGEPYTARDVIFAEKTFHTGYDPIRAIRTQTHKLILNFEVNTRMEVPDDVRNGPLYPAMISQVTWKREHVELYDLAADPHETTNRAGDAALSAVEADLKQRLLAWMEHSNDPLLHGPVASPYYHTTRDYLREV